MENRRVDDSIVRHQPDTELRDIETIDAHLSLDPLLAPLVASRPGLRAPGGWDGFELAVRAILGQQISVIAARRLAAQLVALHGKPLPANHGGHPSLLRVFPSATRLAKANSLGLAMPTARQSSLKALAEASAADPNLFRPFGTIEEVGRKLFMVYMLPFELTSVLLLVAIIGAVILAKRRTL